MTEGFKAWRIPDDRREEFIDIINALCDAVSLNRWSDLGYDWTGDPVVRFADVTVLSENNQKYLAGKLSLIGARDVTESYYY